MTKSHSHDHPSFSTYVAHCVAMLKQSGARITKPRLAVLECLGKARHSLAPKDLLAAMQVGRKKSAVDLATVYRILEAFVELGLVHRVGPQGGYMACAHIDCDVEMHVVTHCLSCDQTQEVDLPPNLQNAVSIYLKSATRFKPTDHFLQMNGVCADCAGRKAGSKR